MIDWKEEFKRHNNYAQENWFDLVREYWRDEMSCTIDDQFSDWDMLADYFTIQ